MLLIIYQLFDFGRILRVVLSLSFFIMIPFKTLVSQGICELNFSGAYKNPSEISLSDFIESLQYIRLETSDESLVGNNPEIYVTDRFVITRTFRKCPLFRREDGKFIREIGHYGKDPGGYKTNIGLFNELSSVYYFRGWKRDLVRYSLEGSYLGSLTISSPVLNDSFFPIPDAFSYLSDSIMICNHICLDGTEPNSFYFFDDKGELLKTIPNWMRLKNKQNSVYRTPEM